MSVRAYVELARVSNLPTCATNVLTGVAIGAASAGTASFGTGSFGTGRLDWLVTAGMVVAIMFLYVAGVALNDVLDAQIDRAERPERPIPSGRITESAALKFIWVCSTVGLGIMAVIGLPVLIAGFALTVAIVLYDVLHKKTAASVVLMGACRGLVYVTAAIAVAWPIDWKIAGPLAGALALYIVMLTVVARVETSQRRQARFALALVLPIIALAPMAVANPETWSWPIVAAAILVAWLLFSSTHLLARPPRIGGAVHGWLAGICLIDGVYLVLLDRPPLAAAAAGCFLGTILLQRVASGT